MDSTSSAYDNDELTVRYKLGEVKLYHSICLTSNSICGWFWAYDCRTGQNKTTSERYRCCINRKHMYARRCLLANRCCPRPYAKNCFGRTANLGNVWF